MTDAAAGSSEDFGSSGALPMQTRLLSGSLLRLLYLQRLSGAETYRQATGFVESQWRIIIMLGNYRGLTSGEVVALTGSEKAQVSRTVASLSEAGLIERESLRSRILLSETGQAAFARILEIVRRRNAAFTLGLTDEESEWLVTTTGKVTERAIELLAQERAILPQGGRPAQEPPMPARLEQPDAGGPVSRMIAPLLIRLSAYLRRSAGLAYRREIGLSPFQSHVLLQVADLAPVPLLRLVEEVDRDKSQIGRTIDSLQEQGLVRRTPVRGRAIAIETTEHGREVYAEMYRMAVQRDEFIGTIFAPGERDRYFALLDRLIVNAERLVNQPRGPEPA